MNPVPLFLIAVTLPLLLGGCGVEEPVAENKPENKKDELDPIPNPMTKEFLMGLWALSNNETNLIMEIKNMGKSGTWKIKSKFGPNKNELVDHEEATWMMKYVNQRYIVREIAPAPPLTSANYSVMTYDYHKAKYVFWEFFEDNTSAKFSGTLSDTKLIEWNSVSFPREGEKMIIRDRAKSPDSFEVEIERSKDNNVVMVGELIGTWQKALNEELLLPKAKAEAK